MSPINFVGSIVFLSFLIGCSSADKNVKSNKGVHHVREARSAPIRLKPYREVTLENGLKVLFIRDVSLPRVSLNLLVKSGLREEPADKGGINTLTADLLETGTLTKSATQIADEFADLGTDLSIAPGSDATMITSDCLVNSSDKLLQLFFEVISSPSFKDGEISRLKAQYVAAIKKRADDPARLVAVKFESTLFSGHSYERSLLGDEKSLKKIRKQDIIKHYLGWYRPNNSTLAVVGSLSDAFEKKVVETFKAWPQRKIKKIEDKKLDDFQDFKMKLITKSGLAQTQIRIGQLGVQRQNEDFLKLRIANEIFGGGFASRLNQKIRDDLGLTYSIGSSVDARFDRGIFTVSTFTKNDSVGKTIDETLKLIENFVTNGVDQNELQAAKNLLIGQFPRAVETADRLASNYLYLDFYGVPRSYLVNFNKNVEKVTLEEINNVIRKYYSPKNLRIVIYGDESVILEQIKTYNPEIEKL